MFDFHEKRRIRNWLYSKPTIGILLVLVGLMSVSVYERYQVEREMVAKRIAKEEELEVLKGRAAVLEHNVQELQNERGIEEELRSRFDVAREGEEVIVIVEDERTASVRELEEPASSADVVDTATERSWWDSLKFWE